MVHFTRIQMPEGLTASQRKSALKLQVEALSPYSHTGFQVVWSGNLAQVWFWDEARIASQRPPKKRVQTLPQTLLQPPLDEGIRLLQHLHGYEGQYWAQGQLHASQYWRVEPNRETWLAFQREAGVAAEAQQTDVPSPQQLEWLDQPYARVAQFELSGLAGKLPVLWYSAIAALLLLAIWHGVAYLKYRQANELLEARAEILREAASGVLETRNAALDALAQLEQLQALLQRPNTLQIMDDLLGILPQGIHIKSWKQLDSTLIVDFAGKRLLNTAKLIDSIQQLHYVTTVQAGDAKADELQLKIGLRL